jgi:DNA polymerase-3 subunit delta'
MANLPVAPTTATAVATYIQNPSQVLVLHGETGVGKQGIANRILAGVLGLDQAKLPTYPYLITIEPVKDAISIDTIREMQSGLIRSVPGDQPFRRAVLVAQAEKLTKEAQNALLKSLEEPPTDTIFVLCVTNIQSLLSTVVSRSQPLAVLPITETAAKEHFGDSPETVKAYHMAEGRAELMDALLTDTEHPLLTTIDEAKSVLRKTPYERLLLINNLAKDKQVTQELLSALQLLARISLVAAVNNDSTVTAKRWHRINKQVIAARKSLNKNAGTKLVLTDLFLHL